MVTGNVERASVQCLWYQLLRQVSVTVRVSGVSVPQTGNSKSVWVLLQCCSVEEGA